jgi:ornithine carbamoyltransferase
VPGEGNSYMREVAKYANVPVMNMQCDIDHPFQMFADLMTLREEFGDDLRGRKIAVSWAYAPSYAKPVSVPQGLVSLMTRYGMEVTLAHPPEFKLMPDVVKQAKKNAQAHGGKLDIVDSMDTAFENADVVYPKSWGILDLFGKPEEALAIAKNYKSWICDAEKMSLAKKHAIYMHCLPADRGKEVTDEVIDGPQSRVYPEAENRLHTAKAVMALTM